MIKSMTGFSKIEKEFTEGKFYGEARSLNNRYLEINLRLPKLDYTYEYNFRERVKKYIKRGKIDIVIKWERPESIVSNLKINEDVVQMYLKTADFLKKKYRLKGSLTIENIFGMKDIFVYEENNNLPENYLTSSFEELLKRLDEERKKEGKIIEKDLISRIKTISAKIKEIEKQLPKTIKAHENRLREKIKEVTKDSTLDETKILQELALYMERIDISEETTRLKGHLKNFKETLSSDDAVGRKLDFIIQEMVRETNTIGSKACDFSISEKVVQIKVEIEKMREQVQNVE
ncbi:MAG: YicC family protein [Syntrophorhabdaceae bacterium]|nr:YicC family protein [Syntrophorhabdaceae bacterium]